MAFPVVPQTIPPPRLSQQPDVQRAMRQLAAYVHDRLIEVQQALSGQITPIEILDELPPAGQQGRVVYLTLDRKVYRDTGAAWSLIADGGDLSPGSVGSSQLATGAILTQHLAAGSVTADKLSVARLSAISADMGTLALGRLQSADNRFTLDLDGRVLQVYDSTSERTWPH